MALSNIHLTPQLVQAVRDAVDIIDVAGETTRIQKRGKRWIGLCPFHKEKSPSFSVDPDQGLFYCFGCGAGGDAIKLFMQQTGDDFPAAIEALARRYGIPLPKATSGGRRTEQGPRVGDALEAAAEYFRDQLGRSPAAKAYLDRRQVPEDQRERFGLGYAPEGWRNLVGALARSIPLDALEAAGLIGRAESRGGEPYDRFRHRLMFPIYSPSGRLVGFGGRTLGDDKAKYINTRETEQFHKGKLLFGFHQAKRSLREGGKALLVEGYTDVIAAATAGIEWSIAGMGTALTAEQARLLGRYAEEVIVAYDGDPAGENAFRKSLPILLAEGLTVRRARFPEGHDPDSLRIAEGPGAVVAAVESAADGLALELERLVPEVDSPAAKSKAAAAIGELLRPIRDEITRYEYGRRAAERLGLPLGLLLGRVKPVAAVAPEARVADRHLVGTKEELAVFLLLQGAESLPPPDDLPRAEVFFDEACRNIYEVFYDLYRRGAGRRPTVNDVLSELGSEGGAIDLAARILLEESASGRGNLSQALEPLQRRWQKHRLPELNRLIKQAQNRGDQQLLSNLLEEQRELNRSLHPTMIGKFW